MKHGYKVFFMNSLWAWFAEEEEAKQYVIDCQERYTMGDEYTIEEEENV